MSKINMPRKRERSDRAKIVHPPEGVAPQSRKSRHPRGALRKGKTKSASTGERGSASRNPTREGGPQNHITDAWGPRATPNMSDRRLGPRPPTPRGFFTFRVIASGYYSPTAPPPKLGYIEENVRKPRHPRPVRYQVIAYGMQTATPIWPKGEYLGRCCAFWDMVDHVRTS